MQPGKLSGIIYHSLHCTGGLTTPTVLARNRPVTLETHGMSDHSGAWSRDPFFFSHFFQNIFFKFPPSISKKRFFPTFFAVSRSPNEWTYMLNVAPISYQHNSRGTKPSIGLSYLRNMVSRIVSHMFFHTLPIGSCCVHNIMVQLLWPLSPYRELQGVNCLAWSQPYEYDHYG